MTHQQSGSRGLFLLCCILLFAANPTSLKAEPTPAALSSFNSYIATLESRLAQQHGSQNSYLAPVSPAEQSEPRLRNGELIIEQLTPSTPIDLPGAMLHHWRGTAFAPGATAADFERMMKDYNAYPQYYSPQVLQAKILAHQGDRFQVIMRVRQRHILTVVMDTTYDRYLWPPRRAPRIQHLPQHANLRNRLPRH